MQAGVCVCNEVVSPLVVLEGRQPSDLTGYTAGAAAARGRCFALARR